MPDINDVISLILYIRFTPKTKQKPKYVRAFIRKASLGDLNHFGDYISLKCISSEDLPLLINVTNKHLLNFLKRKCS